MSDLILIISDMFFFSSRRRHTRWPRDWSSDVCSSDLDPWDLVIEAVEQMTAHSDVMRSDRLKQVMQEIDPAFNEKDLGFSRFSKFVIEAAHKGLITLTKLDNGQYEIGLGPGVPGAAAQPAGGGAAAFERPRER